MNFYSAISGMKILGLALAVAGGGGGAAYAADTAKTNLEVSIQIKGGCTMDLSSAGGSSGGTVGTIDFGAVNLRSNRGFYAGTIYIQCTNDHIVHMSLNTGLNGDGATLSSRRLKLENSGACTDQTCIPYNVYKGQDGNRVAWGLSGSDIYDVSAARYDDGDSGGKGTPAPFWIEVPTTTANLKSGDYTDQLTITMDY